MIALGSQIAQVRPPTNNVIVNVFTASVLTEISLIKVCNTSGAAANFSFFHDDDGTTFDQTTAIYWGLPVNNASTFTFHALSEGAGILVSEGGSLALASSVGDALTISIYGTTARITGYEGSL